MVGQIGTAMDLPMPKNSNTAQIFLKPILMVTDYPMDGKSLMD
jgi:hypothetical protein